MIHFHCVMKKGFGLAYVLVILATVSTLLASAYLRHSQTIMAMKASGRDQVQARFLAESGLQMAVILLRDEDHDWYKDFAQPVTSADLGIDESNLGGRFELTFHSIPSAYSGQGDFITVRSRGLVGRNSASSMATVKITCALTNYLFSSRGDFAMVGNLTPDNSGPILVSSNGDQGNFTFWHDRLNLKPLFAGTNHEFGSLKFQGSIQATGSIAVSNVNETGPVGPPLELNGPLSPMVMTHSDIPGVTEQGSLEFLDQVEFDAQATLNAGIPSIDEVFTEAALAPGLHTIDISSYPTGVLAEFQPDGSLIISEAVLSPVGRVYDKDIYQEYTAQLAAVYLAHNPLQADPDQMLRREVAWDDPDFNNHPYPPDLISDIDGDGVVETEGDSYLLHNLERGTTLRTFQLDRSSFTTVRFLTARTDYPTPTGPKGPPLFLRGIVRGRAAIFYDVADPAQSRDRLQTIVLNQHDWQNPSTTGIPGGLRYLDPTIRMKADGAASSADRLIVVCGGQMTAAGNSTYLKRRIRDLTDQPFDFQQRLFDLDQIYTDRFAGGPWPADEFVICPSVNVSQVSLQGSFVANQLDLELGRLTADGVLAPDTRVDDRRYPSPNTLLLWDQFPNPVISDLPTAPVPAWADPQEAAVFGIRFRNTATSGIPQEKLRGSYASLGAPFSGRQGSRYYDYSLRDLDRQTLQEAGLPISTVLCTWQRE